MLRRLDYAPYPFSISSTKLLFELDPQRTIVSGRLCIERKGDASSDEALVLNLARGVKLLELSVNGKELSAEEFSRCGDLLTIACVPDVFSLFTKVEINPLANESGEGLYISDGMFCTQCEAEGFRCITPYSDRPDVLAPIETTIIADAAKYPVLLSNGNLAKEYVDSENRRVVTWNDPAAKSPYLFALVGGDLAVLEDRFVTMSGRNVTLRIYSDTEETVAKCRLGMESLKKAMRWDEVAFRREYDLDLYMIVAVSSFNMGAMENRGLNIFNLKYVSGDPVTATDGQQIGIESVIAHEYFHNWSGNLVTVRDWFQLSLKEGFTVFRDQEFSRDIWGLGQMIDTVNKLRTYQFVEDSGPMAHPIRPDEAKEISNLYTATVYNKGAEVVRMQQTMLGHSAFREGTDLYFSRHFGQPATCDDFVAAMESASGIGLTQFRRWYAQAGTPTVSVRKCYDPATQTLTLCVSQSCPPTLGQPTKEPFHIPFRIGFLDHDGNDMKVVPESPRAFDPATGILHIKKASEEFVFSGVTVDPIISLNRGFSAPVKVDYPYGDEELFFLMANDWDEFNRYDSGQTIAMRILQSLVSAHKEGKVLIVPPRFIQVFRGILESHKDGAIPSDLCGAMLELPNEQSIASMCTEVDPTAIHLALRYLRKLIADECAAELKERYEALSEPYAFDPESVARRRIKNCCLSYLGLRERVNQFATAENMTDELAALGGMVNTPERTTDPKVKGIVLGALAGFYEKHRNDRNAVDTWLTIQANSSLTDLQGIKDLMVHPEFSMKVPNRVRAVIGAFANGNPLQFHNMSGSGYRFLADIIIELDRFNPQVAAGMVTPLIQWKRYDSARQVLMKGELSRLSNLELSVGVKEKIEKSLHE